MFTIYYNYAKFGNIMTITKLIEMNIIQIVLYLIHDIGNLNPHTYIIGMGLINRLLKAEGLTQKLRNLI